MTQPQQANDVPSFAIVGKVNMGKTSVLATLLEQDDNSVLRVSNTPGETTHCQDHFLKLNENPLIRFIDTPGFARPIDAMLEIKKFHGESESSPGKAAIQHFITHHKKTDEFIDEVLLLEPLINGAGIIYIIDTNHPIRDSYIAEMEILRWTGCQRLAVINNQSASDSSSEWKSKLGSYFNLVRTFNAHSATYEERHKLLKSLLEIDESHVEQIKKTISSIETEWQSRRENSAEHILNFLLESLGHHETVSLSRRDCENENRRGKTIEELKKSYFTTIRKKQNQCFETILKIYKHNLIEIKENAELLSGIDIEAEETWTKWGLSRSQLTIAGGLTGAAAGGAIDLTTAGATHGLGALFGGIAGLATTYFKGGSLPNFNITLEDITGDKAHSDNEQRKLIIKSPENENFPWILLDSIVEQYHAMLKRAHGRRDTQQITSSQKNESYVRKLTVQQRSAVTKWIVSCKKNKPDYELEPKVLEAIESLLTIS